MKIWEFLFRCFFGFVVGVLIAIAFDLEKNSGFHLGLAGVYLVLALLKT